MVRRAVLTEDFVRSVEPPDRGEVWIADTRLRGFGLRLWAGKSGHGAAFAIRTVAADGRSVRRTFDPKDHIPRWSGRENDIGSDLASCADAAREWARDEIHELKRRRRPRSDESGQRARNRKRINRLPFGDALDDALRHMETQGASGSYLDSVRKSLLPGAFSDELLRTPLREINGHRLAREIATSHRSLSTVLKLRTFVSSAVRWIEENGGRINYSAGETNEEFWDAVGRRNEISHAKVRDIPDEVFPDLFAYLEAQTERWVQAFCIRLFFEFGCKLTPLRTAQWWQVCEGYWLPYGTDRGYWFESREAISSDADRLLTDLATRVTRAFGPNPHLFPSHLSNGATPISSVERLWKQAKRDLHLLDAPLTVFAQRYRPKNAPSQHSGFLKRYGRRLTQGKMAELSKAITNQRENSFLSNHYSQPVRLPGIETAPSGPISLRSIASNGAS